MFWYVVLMPLSPLYLMFGLVFPMREGRARSRPRARHDRTANTDIRLRGQPESG